MNGNMVTKLKLFEGVSIDVGSGEDIEIKVLGVYMDGVELNFKGVIKLAISAPKDMVITKVGNV